VGLVLLHHTVLYMLEAFTFFAFGYTLLRIVLNTVCTTGFVLCYEFLRSK
jgi:hypothetical protein